MSEPTKQQLRGAAVAKDKEPWHPIDEALKFIASKTGADKPVPPTPAPGLPEKLCGGGKAKKMSAGGTASSRADGIAQRGKTKGKWV